MKIELHLKCNCNGRGAWLAYSGPYHKDCTPEREPGELVQTVEGVSHIITPVLCSCVLKRIEALEKNVN